MSYVRRRRPTTRLAMGSVSGGLGPADMMAIDRARAYNEVPVHPFNTTLLCDVKVNGVGYRVPCDLALGPRPAVGNEGPQWLKWVEDASRRYATMLAPDIERGALPFAKFIGPDGKLYSKHFNGTQKVGAFGLQPGWVVIMHHKNFGEVVSDIGKFLADNLCLIGGAAMAAVPGLQVAAAGAAGLCAALTGQKLPGAAAPPSPPPPPQTLEQKLGFNPVYVFVPLLGAAAALILSK